MNRSIEGELQAIVRQYGRGVCDDPQRLKALLRDKCPSATKGEIHVLMGAVTEGIAKDIARSDDHVPRDLLFAQLVKRLQQNMGLGDHVARWAVETWGVSLGWIEPGQRTAPAPVEAKRPAAEPKPTPAANSPPAAKPAPAAKAAPAPPPKPMPKPAPAARKPAAPPPRREPAVKAPAPRPPAPPPKAQPAVRQQIPQPAISSSPARRFRLSFKWPGLIFKFPGRLRRSRKFRWAAACVVLLCLVGLVTSLTVQGLLSGSANSLHREADGTFSNSIDMKLVLVRAGEFMMGRNLNPTGRLLTAIDRAGQANESPLHEVHITRPFYLGKYEVTQREWVAVMHTTPWEGEENVLEGPDYPATYISYDDAVEFCRRLSRREKSTYRLPTEAEWEYACRAESTTTFSYGNGDAKLDDYAWFAGNSAKRYAHQVGRKGPNPWGLHDMHGNVFEWCSDWYDDDYYQFLNQHSRHDDPQGPTSGELRVLRGGSWSSSRVLPFGGSILLERL